jgi:hypothetical protein
MREVPAAAVGDRLVGSCLWLYTNFDCNLRCDSLLRALAQGAARAPA